MKFQRKGKGPTLVFQHGFMSGAAYWQHQIDYFSQFYDVIATNLPGYSDHQLAQPGSDDQVVDSIPGFVAYLHDVLDELEVEKCVLVGHSMGGMISQEFALTHPERLNKVVLYATGPLGTMPGRFEPVSTSVERILKEGREQTLKNTVASWFLKREEDQNYREAMMLAEKTPLNVMLGGYRAMEKWQAQDRLAQITTPTLVLWGDEDRSYRWPNPETLWNRIDGAALSVIQGVAHNVHLEKPDLFNHILSDFIAS